MSSRSKLTRYKRISIISIFLICLIILSAICLLFMQFYKSIWDGSGRFTLVINSDPLILFSLQGRTQKGVIVKIPGNTILDVPSGFQKFLATSVYRLGNLEKNKNGGILISKAIENTFGLSVDRYISDKSISIKLDVNSKEDVLTLKRKHFSFIGIPGSLYQAFKLKTMYDTNLTLPEMYHLWNAIRKLTQEEISFLDPSLDSVFVESKLPDQTKVYEVNTELLNIITGDRFTDQRIRTENVTVTVTNAAEKDLLATQLGRVLKSIGSNVLIRSTAVISEEGGCTVFISRNTLNNSVIVSWLKRKYACQVVLDTAGDKANQTDINIYLGKSFIK